MGVGCAQSEVADESAEAGFEISSFKENGEHQTPIKFGSHGLDEPVKGESKVSELKFPKDAAEEWPEPKQIHSFWFVKYRSFNDQNLRAKFEQADKELQKQNDSRSHLIEKLREKKSERAKIISELKALGAEEKEHWSKIEEKKKEIEPLKKVFGQLRGAGLANRDGKAGLCSSEEELNNVIKSLQYRIQHESIPLSEEKQILRNIKLLESTREKVVENAATRGKNQESMGEKEALQGQVKLIGVGLDDVRKNHRLIKAKIEQLDDIKKAIDKEIKSIDEELIEATRKRAKTFENIQELKNQREEGNLPFYENRSLLIKAKELAAKKDVESLRDLCENEVSKFLSLWSSNKTFREDYEKRILSSLDARQLSRDGRIRIPGERPILSIEASTPAESEVVAKGSVEQPKELSSSRSQAEASLAEKDEEEKILMQANEANNKKKETIKRPADAEEEDEYFIPEKLQKDPLKVNEVDKQKLKEMRREEEMAKAKQALERKKKMAEKAAAKAAIKAQKEAEKKEKEREKRLKKKAGPSVGAQETEEQSEASAEVVEAAEKVEEVVEAPVPEKNMDRKMAVRSRNRPKGLNSLPKTLIKRKKPKNYWMLGAAVAAAVAVFLLAIVGYRFLV